MEQQQQAHYAPGSHVDPRAQLHAGVDRFMAGVYAWMAIGVGVTAVVAGLISASPEMLMTIHGTGLKWVVVLAPLGFIFFIGAKIPTMDPKVAVASFLAYAGMIGAMLSWVPARLSVSMIGAALGITAVTFGAMSAYGYFTKRDLSPMGSFLSMGFIGIIVAMIASYFIPGLSLFVSVGGVLLFAAFTAYDAQTIRQIYLQSGGAGNLAIVGALSLYANFINIFMFILRLLMSSDD